MATITTLFNLSFLLILHCTLSSSSDSDNLEFQLLHVPSSLHLTHHVFSPTSQHDDHHSLPQDQLQNLPFSNYSSPFSLPLHPRSSFPDFIAIHRNNYTSLTLSRLARDHHRHHSILSSLQYSQRHLQSPLISGIRDGSGEYFARIGVGTPTKDLYMAIDTGSDITWLQCQPCSACYSQRDPIFNPAQSSTYRKLTCDSDQCNALHVSGCQMGTCLYEVDYGDGSRTIGTLGTDTVSFERTGSVPGVAIGCGHDNRGLFAGSAGLLGIGGGSLSLPSQIRATSFSYCLVNRDSTASSTLDFNTAAPADSVLAPMLTNSFISTYRFVALTGLIVGGSLVRIPASLFAIGGDGRGGVIVDSGTAVTRLRSEAYSALRDTFQSMSQDLPADTGFSLFDTCYDLSSKTTVRVPTVGFQFEGGKTLQLPATNYLIPVSSSGKFCLAFAATEGELSIIGNVQQQGTRVSYNLANKYVGFSPNKC